MLSLTFVLFNPDVQVPSLPERRRHHKQTLNFSESLPKQDLKVWTPNTGFNARRFSGRWAFLNFPENANNPKSLLLTNFLQVILLNTKFTGILKQNNLRKHIYGLTVRNMWWLSLWVVSSRLYQKTQGCHILVFLYCSYLLAHRKRQQIM